VRTIADALAQLETRRAFVVHGFGGIDELSPCGPNQVSEVVDGAVRDRVVDPAELGIEPSDPVSLIGGSPKENAVEIRRILVGEERGPKREAVLLNAAGGIAAAGHAHDLREGLEVARTTLESGAAAARLEELAAFTRESP
jgi:anthranilate phosphoribosyltransferase